MAKKNDDRRSDVEVRSPNDSADYLHGPMPRYSTKNNVHMFTHKGRVTNLNALPPFEGYDDSIAGGAGDPAYDD